ncbi:MAG: tyrosine-type recombinase/integrase [Actinobacteria bacterium]|nr:tyrosine-type recombinase/integrase [Actinomycetota bacterium]
MPRRFRCPPLGRGRPPGSRRGQRVVVSTPVFAPTAVAAPARADPDDFSHSFSRLCQRAGLGHWHPDELRHSGTSLMLAQGTPLHVVSDVLGHASIAITKDVDGHLLEGDKRAAAESMSRVLFSGC